MALAIILCEYDRRTRMPVEIFHNNADLVQFLEARQGRLHIAKATRTSSAQTLHWVAVESQHTHSIIATPPDTESGSGNNPYTIDAHFNSSGTWGSCFYFDGPPQ
jgi:hypothetical protein